MYLRAIKTYKSVVMYSCISVHSEHAITSRHVNSSEAAIVKWTTSELPYVSCYFEIVVSLCVMRHECSVSLESFTPAVDCCTLILWELGTILFYFKKNLFIKKSSLKKIYNSFFQYIDRSHGLYQTSCLPKPQISYMLFWMYHIIDNLSYTKNLLISFSWVHSRVSPF